MNDAKGHASNLLILSLATALVGTGILSWSLTQSNLFKKQSPTRLESSLATKNSVSESIMTNKPIQNPVKIHIPNIKTSQAKKPASTDAVAMAPDEVTDPADEARQPPAIGLAELTNPPEKTPPNKTALEKQAPETPVGEAIVAEKIILPETRQNEITATISERNIPAAAIPAKTLPNETAATIPDTNTTEIIPVATSPDEIAKATPEKSTTETIQVATSPDEIAKAGLEKSTTETTPIETVSTEVRPPETQKNEDTIAIAEALTTEVTPASETASANTTIAPEATTDATETLANTNPATIEPIDENIQIAERPKNGWIYAGKYEDGKWVKRGLELPIDKLPDAGNIYKLIWGTNVRLAPPGKRKVNGENLAKNIDYLGVNQEIEITSIKNSGKTGHIWLEIKY